MTDTSPEAIITTRDEECLEFKNAEELKCIIGTTTPFEYWCGDQMSVVEVSSRIVESGNEACLPGLKAGFGTFYWLPDDPMPWARWKT